MEKAIHAVEAMLQCATHQPLSAFQGASYEIEARLGTLVPSSKPGQTVFVPGVTPLQWEACRKRLNTCKDWTRSSEIFHQQDTFHKHPDYGLIRTSVMHAEGTSVVTYMHKSKRGHVDIPLPEFSSLSPEGGQFAVRVCLSIERFFHAKTLFPTKEERFVKDIKRVRQKQRANYCLHNILEYSMTKTFSGRNYIESEEAMSEPPVFEVELECIDIKGMLARYGSARKAGRSFAMKIYNLVDGKDWSAIAMAVNLGEEKDQSGAFGAMPALPVPVQKQSRRRAGITAIMVERKNLHSRKEVAATETSPKETMVAGRVLKVRALPRIPGLEPPKRHSKEHRRLQEAVALSMSKIQRSSKANHEEAEVKHGKEEVDHREAGVEDGEEEVDHGEAGVHHGEGEVDYEPSPPHREKVERSRAPYAFSMIETKIARKRTRDFEKKAPAPPKVQVLDLVLPSPPRRSSRLARNASRNQAQEEAHDLESPPLTRSRRKRVKCA